MWLLHLLAAVAAVARLGPERFGFFLLIEVNVFIIVSGAFLFFGLFVKISESESETRSSGPVSRRRSTCQGCV